MLRPGRDLTLNALGLALSQTTVAGWASPFDDSIDLDALRRDAGGRWRYHRRGDELLTFRIDPAAGEPAGEPREWPIADNLGTVAALVTPAIAALMPEYPPLRQRPYRFRGRRGIVDQDLAQQLGLDHPLLPQIDVAARYELDGHVLHVDGEPQLVLTVGVASDWRIRGTLADLERLGLQLDGYYVVWTRPRTDGERLAGQLLSLSRGTAQLLAPAGRTVEAATDELSLEASRAAVTSLLRTAVGPAAARRYVNALVDQVGEFLAGPPLLAEVRRVGAVLAKYNPIALTDHLQCSVGNPIVLPRIGASSAVTFSRPVHYCFDPSRTKRDDIAWRGLERYGPFSGDTFARRSPVILVVHPLDAKGQVEGFVQAFRDGILDQGLRAYQRGFTRTFGLADPRFIFTGVPLSSGVGAAAAYRRTIEDFLAGQTNQPEAAIVVLRDQDADLPDASSPYLYAKAVLLMAGVPVQEVRLSKATLERAALQYVLQNLSVALYAKMNGIPWTVDQDLTIADEVVIGVGTAELADTRLTDRQRYVGVTTVFRGDGNYLLGYLSEECTYADYPRALQDSTVSVLAEIKTRNAWQPGDTVRVVVHAPRPPRNVDLAQLMSAALATVGGEQNVEFAFVQVSHDHPFVLFDESERGQHLGHRVKGEMAPRRGLVVATSPYSRLLCTIGPNLVKRPGLPLPRPVQLRLHRASTFRDMTYLTEQVLKFTALTWRSTLPAADPVTIYYSELIAELLARLKHVPGWSPASLRSRLRASRWFL